MLINAHKFNKWGAILKLSLIPWLVALCSTKFPSNLLTRFSISCYLIDKQKHNFLGEATNTDNNLKCVKMTEEERLHHFSLRSALEPVIMWQQPLLYFRFLQGFTTLSASPIIRNMTVEYNEHCVSIPHIIYHCDIHSECMNLQHVPRITCSHVVQVHRAKRLSRCITCMSDGVVFLLFFTENNFHSRCHRKVATRHTLPNIQTSLSLRKFSMMEAFLFLPLLSTCTVCLSYPSGFATCSSLRCWAASSWRGPRRLALVMKQPDSYSCALNLQTRLKREQELCAVKPPTRPPSHPFTCHLASSLPPTSEPKRREHTVSETRAGQVVLGSGCRFCMQNQMLVEAAGMLARPLWYPLTSDTALHACMHTPK